MVFNATLKNNISVFRGGVPGENRQTCHKSLTNFITMLYRVHLTRAIQAHNDSGDRH